MMLLKLAWKNIWRNKLRSGVILLAITIGLTVAVFVVAFANGMVNQLIDDTLNTELTHLQINRQSFLDFGDLEYAFPEQPLKENIEKIPEVKGVSSRIIINATASTSHNIGGVELTCIDPEQEKMVSELYRYIPDSMGNYFTDSLPNAILVGKKFAEKYQLQLHNKVILSFADKNGEQFAGAFRVCGIFHTNNPAFETTKVFARITDVNQLCPLPADSIHEFAIRLIDNSDPTVNAVQAQIKKFLTGDEIVRSWKEINPLMSIYSNFMGVMLLIIVAIILFALGFGIVNTVLMSVMERRRELSMLMAIGMNRRKVMSLIITESTILTMLGGFLGIILGCILVVITAHSGIDMSQSLGSYSAVGVAPIIYPSIALTTYLEISVMVMITGILSAIYPARVAIKMKPAEGVRG
jgi:ABC-type lipoprotein release transport system permease subunit